MTGQTLNGATVNGTKPRVPTWGAVTPIHLGGIAPVDQPQPEPQPTTTPAETAPMPEPAYDPVKLAEADRIRTLAEAEADAVRTKAIEDARKLKLANDEAEKRAREKDAARDARIAESNRRRAEADRAAANDATEADAEKAAEAAAAQEIADADGKWRSYAIRFAIVCGIVSLPVQMSFFWNPRAPWMAAAPVMLEGAAWVVHRGAHAAAVSKRPVWHYRVIVWLLALIAAGINLYHGLHSFDPGTALATAFASIAGPGVWDLHENGRMRRRDGVLTRRERKAQKNADKQAAAEKAAREAQQRADREAAATAAKEAAEKLAKDREENRPEVWKYALKLAADLGETTVTEAVWRRAHKDVEGTDPGDSAEAQKLRNAAARRLLEAHAGAPEKGVWKVSETTTNAQRAIQVKAPRHGSSYKPVPPRRTKGDSAPFHPIAKTLAADAKRQSNVAQREGGDV